ncbi:MULTISPECIES: DUF305 domain-containing protein [Microbacterium]|jgi:uncharacterized protein (DUF305 family)|nr:MULTISPECIES: DUF305 domain-containing protein [Microbacterium]AVL96142.1 DUF305 domain-containing protein [Microbacterium sp. str. 'China']KYJ98105.1 DUF305 domain-containing protein [Microbacterium sp. CH1]MCT1394435.1 DUF305 domain-containing protein [Microbacterium sp. p3-SID338]MDH5132004.1 DUF305 domain-containing protein [Microbacterium sp. RD10]MDH5135733.1 DUF305 domain-containing protein [Microbacterium sp. RD11]
MNKKIPLALSTGALTLALVLTGCADTGTAPSGTSSSPSASTSSSASTEADEMFVTMMIPHHEQAIEMSDILLAKDGADPRVVELAEQIKAAQGPEIDKMLGWLEDWGVEYDPDSMGGMDHGSMGGDDSMMSEEDMTMLEDADATEASRLFLEQMIVHHEGAVDMAQTALDDAQNPDVLELAQQVIDDQTAEIATMKDLLGEL